MGPLTSGEPCPQHLCEAGSVLDSFKHGLLLICCLCPWHPGFQRVPLQSPAVFSEGQGLAFLSPWDEEMFLKSAWRFPTESTGVSAKSQASRPRIRRTDSGSGQPSQVPLFLRTQCFHGLCGSVLQDPSPTWLRGRDSEPCFPFGLCER